jgi:hypothetical protein
LCFDVKLPEIHGAHYAGLSDFSVRGAVRRHFFGKWRSSIAGSSDGKMNVQSACALNTRYMNEIARIQCEKGFRAVSFHRHIVCFDAHTSE